MKRMFSVLCLLLVVSLLFTGCVQKKESGGAGETATQEKTLKEESKNPLHVAYIDYVCTDLTEEQRNYFLSSIHHTNLLYREEDTIDMGNYQVVMLSAIVRNAAVVEPVTATLFEKEYRISYSYLYDSNKYGGVIFVYQNGTLIPLPEACEKGIVTEEDLKVIDEKSTAIFLAPSTVA